MKKSNEFDSPRRQSQWAIIFIVLRFIRKLALQLWPLLAAFALGRSGNSWDKYELIAAFFGGFGMIVSVISYYRFYFQISDTELIIRKGILKKVKLNIPFERIQSINFKQTVIHRLLQVTEIVMETAGSKEQETKIDALSIPDAERLRQYILDRKADLLKDGKAILYEDQQVHDEVTTEHTILSLSPRDLLKVGLTQNHFAPVGLLGGLIGTGFFYSYTFGIEVEDAIRTVWKYGENLTIPQMILGGIFALVISVSFSVIKTFLRYYNLRFWRSGERFQVVQGLLTRREFAALDKKIQILNWGSNPIERWMSLINIRFSQAKSGNKEIKTMQFEIPGCTDDKLSFIKKEWLGYVPSEPEEYHPVSIHYFWHFLIYAVLIGIPILVGIFVFGPIKSGIVVTVIWLLSILFRWKSYKKKIYAFSNLELYVGGGVLGHRHSLLPVHKVQNVSIQQNPYQWRRDLSDLNIYTAAGTITIPYIGSEQAQKIMDHLIYKVEISKQKWM